MYSRAILSNTATIIDETRLKLTPCLLKIVQRDRGLRAITAPSDKQPNKFSQLQKMSLNLLQLYSNFPCLVKVKRDKLALINRLCKKKAQKIDDNRYFIHENRSREFRPLQEPNRLQDLLNSAHSRAEKK